VIDQAVGYRQDDPEGLEQLLSALDAWSDWLLLLTAD
jgi:hypothetical protein